MIEYPCAKFDDFSFSRFDFIVQTGRHVLRQISLRLVILA